MRLSGWLWASVALLGLSGCQGSLFFWRKAVPLDVDKVCEARGAPTSTAEQTGAKVEMQEVRYDGNDIHGRLLISPSAGNLCLDKRFITQFDLVTEAVSECDTGRDLGFFVSDVLAPPLKEGDVLVLEPGYWYGKDISVFLFSEKITGKPSAECIEAEFTFHALNVKHAARFKVRAMRMASSSPNVGTPTPSP
jgi:hypothetical protein